MKQRILVLVFVTAYGFTLVNADSLWKESTDGKKEKKSLYTQDKKGFQKHDLVTVKISEEVKTTRDQKVSASKESNFLTRFIKSFNLDTDGKHWATAVHESKLPELEVEAENEFDGQDSSNRKHTFAATITAKVIEVLPNGNLVLEARRSMIVNDEKQSIVFSGLVRSKDVSIDNTILSSKVADASIKFEGDGPLTNMTKKGLLTRLFDFILPW